MYKKKQKVLGELIVPMLFITYLQIKEIQHHHVLAVTLHGSVDKQTICCACRQQQYGSRLGPEMHVENRVQGVGLHHFSLGLDLRLCAACASGSVG